MLKPSQNNTIILSFQLTLLPMPCTEVGKITTDKLVNNRCFYILYHLAQLLNGYIGLPIEDINNYKNLFTYLIDVASHI